MNPCLQYIHLPYSHRDQWVNAVWKIIVMYSLNYRMHVNLICKMCEVFVIGNVVVLVQTALENYRETL